MEILHLSTKIEKIYEDENKLFATLIIHRNELRIISLDGEDFLGFEGKFLSKKEEVYLFSLKEKFFKSQYSNIKFLYGSCRIFRCIIEKEKELKS